MRGTLTILLGLCPYFFVFVVKEKNGIRLVFGVAIGLWTGGTYRGGTQAIQSGGPQPTIFVCPKAGRFAMSKEYEFDRLTVPESVPVITPPPPLRLVTVKGCLFAIVVVTAVLLFTFAISERTPPAETWPAAGPSSTFGQSMMPEPPPCPECRDCESGTWLARFVHTLDGLSATPREIRDVLHRSYVESGFTPSIVSDTGDYGICQINRTANPDVDVDRLLTDAEYAAGECLRVYRTVFKACGAQWECCYRYGVRGCKGRVTVAGGTK
jgi:hypothetical protein